MATAQAFAKNVKSGSSLFFKATFFMRSADRRFLSMAFATSLSCSPERCFPQRMRTTSVSASAEDEGSGGSVGDGDAEGEGTGEGAAACANAADGTNGATAAAAMAAANCRRDGLELIGDLLADAKSFFLEAECYQSAPAPARLLR